MQLTKAEKTVGLVSAITLAVFTSVYLLVQRSVLPSLEPFWLVPAFFAPPLLVWLVRKFPPIFCAGLLFVSNFKDAPAQGVSLSDPTFIMLLLTGAAIALDCLLTFALEKGSTTSFSRLFTGQKTAIFSFVALMLLVVSSYTYTPDTELAKDKIQRLIVFDALLFFAPFILLKSDKEFRQLARAIVALSLALAARTVMGIVNTPVAAAGEDITHIAYGQALGITVLLLFYYRFTDKLAKPIVFSCIPIMILGLVSSAARGPILATILVLAACAVFLRPSTGIMTTRAIRVGVVTTLILSVLAVIVMEQIPSFRDKFEAKAKELTAFAEGAQNPGGDTTDRLQLWSKAANAISQRPVLGWGVGGWVVFQTDENQGPYPHNMILEVGVELGFVGMLALFNFYGNLIAASRRLLKSSERRFDFLIPVVAFTFLTSMVSGDMDNRLFWFWAGALFAAARILAVNNLKVRTANAQPTLAYAV